MKKLSRIILINLAIFFVLISIIELLAALVLDASALIKTPPAREVDQRAFLSNYDTLDWAVPYFLEEGRPKSAEYKSYIGFKQKPFKGEMIHIDSNGFRVTPHPKSLSDTLTQAIFLGGSTMYGSGSMDAYTIPAFCAQSQKAFRILNFAQPAYSAYQSFLLLQLKVTKGLRPGLVVSYDGVNNSPAFHGFFEHSREQFFKEKLQDVHHFSQRQDYYSLRALKSIANVIRSKLKRKKQTSKQGELSFSNPQNELAAIELLESWLAMKKLCQEIGADFICILQPNAFVGNPDISNLIHSDYKNWHHGLQNAYQYYDEVFRLLDTEPYAVLQPHFLDFTKVLDNHPNIYIDFCHLSPNGNEIIAMEILKSLL